MMEVKLKGMKVALWEKREMNDREYDRETKSWIDKGTKSEKTLYTLRDEFGEVLKFLAGNEYRDMEGSQVEVTLGLEYNEYTNVNRMKLLTMEQTAVTKK